MFQLLKCLVVLENGLDGWLVPATAGAGIPPYAGAAGGGILAGGAPYRLLLLLPLPPRPPLPPRLRVFLRDPRLLSYPPWFCW